MKLNYSLYLDDIREPKNEFDYIARSFNEATQIISEKGIPTFISFDHDLGLDDTEEKSGYDLAKWIIEKVLDEALVFPKNFRYNIHSANPVGAKNIDLLFKNYFEKCDNAN